MGVAVNEAARQEAPLCIVKGFCMGAADVVPGVSGGTIALILGIYPRLLGAIRAFDLTFLKLLRRGRWAAAVGHVDAAFLLCLAAGIAMALFFFTRVAGLPELVVTRPQPVYSVFFGLICTSLYLLLRSVADLHLHDALWLLAGALLGIAVVWAVPVNTPETAWFVFLSGAVAICAMLLPGVSGSFVLLVLNKYTYVFGAVARFDVAVLAPFVIGAGCGLVLFSRVLVWCLRRFERATLLVMSGIVLGSLYLLWPFRERGYEMVEGQRLLTRSVPVWPERMDAALFVSLALVAAGALAVLALDRLARRSTPPA